MMRQGFDVELIQRKVNQVEWYLIVNDEPQYKVSIDFLKNRKLWCRTKKYRNNPMNVEVQYTLFGIKDDVTLTSKGYNIELYPNEMLTDKSICVEKNNENPKKCLEYVVIILPN